MQKFHAIKVDLTSRQKLGNGIDLNNKIKHSIDIYKTLKSALIIFKSFSCAHAKTNYAGPKRKPQKFQTIRII